MNHELRSPIPLARRRIYGGHPESHGLAPFKVIIQYAVSGIAGRVEVHHVAIYHQVIRTGWRLRDERPSCGDGQHSNEGEKREILVRPFHDGRRYLKSGPSVQ